MNTQTLQNLVTVIEKERDFQHESMEKIFLCWGEEIGELARALQDGHLLEIGRELSDNLFLLLRIYNMFGLDVEECFREKFLQDVKT